KAAATAASTAFPPALKAATAASVASGCPVAATPFFPRISAAVTLENPSRTKANTVTHRATLGCTATENGLWQSTGGSLYGTTRIVSHGPALLRPGDETAQRHYRNSKGLPEQICL